MKRFAKQPNKKVWLALLAAVVVACSHPAPDVDMAALNTSVQDSMNQTFSSDGQFSPYQLHVDHVILVQSTGNQYEGTATITAGNGQTKDIPVHVTADEGNTVWHTDPGALLFAAS